jgi:hypothetical protein
MILETVYSINHVPVRLTEERWDHIVDRRPYMTAYYDAMLNAVEQPTYILPGHRGSLIAVLPIGKSKYLHVVYREVSRHDGFIITAYIKPKVNKRQAIWHEGKEQSK